MEKSNGKHRQLLEWQVCADEQAWQSAQHDLMARPGNTSDPQTTLHNIRPHNIGYRYRWHLLFGLLILVAYVGWWGGQRAQAGLDAVEAELETEIVAELWQDGTRSGPGIGTEAQGLGITKLPSDPSEIVTKLEIRDLGKDWAVAEVTLKPTAEGPSYRQMRVYHMSERGWKRVEPSAERWGARRHLESKYFVFAYHAIDGEAVMQAAPQLDALYAEMAGYLNEPLFATEMLTITIDPAPTSEVGEMRPGIVVASPNAALLPSNIATSDVLLQSFVLALYDDLAVHAFTEYDMSGQRFRVQNALRLWFIWEYDLPLGVWRKPLVQWIFEAPNDAQHRATSDISASDIPAFAHDLCAHHTLWGHFPPDVAVPILCWQNNNGGAQFTVWRYPSTITELPLSALLYSSIANVDDESASLDVPLPEPGPYAIMLATVFEYVTATYGRDMLPLLLAAIPHHEHAETLIPDLFGVPRHEFENGWRDFLRKQSIREHDEILRMTRP